jgi:DNA-binding GntR family transcriptional regulator
MNAGVHGSGRVASGSFVPFGGAGDTRRWVRVANTLLDRIARGGYRVRLPGRSVLVAEFGVAPRTVQRAITELAGRGVVYRVPGLGYHIRHAGEQAGGVPGPASGGDGADPRAWMRISAALLERISFGQLKPWELLPPRQVLCAEFGCSRSPVTHALTDLARQGVIRRIPGVGYQIQPPAGEVPARAGGYHIAGDLMSGRTL